jgi:hypothetical protein
VKNVANGNPGCWFTQWYFPLEPHQGAAAENCQMVILIRMIRITDPLIVGASSLNKWGRRD